MTCTVPRAACGPGVGTGSWGWLVDFRAQIPWSDGSENGWVGVQNMSFGQKIGTFFITCMRARKFSQSFRTGVRGGWVDPTM
eukprot:COSAG05_NODE_754_length_7519_cov_4.955256_2_plen_82_part_00